MEREVNIWSSELGSERVGVIGAVGGGGVWWILVCVEIDSWFICGGIIVLGGFVCGRWVCSSFMVGG